MIALRLRGIAKTTMQDLEGVVAWWGSRGRTISAADSSEDGKRRPGRQHKSARYIE
jgi:hypothetical protein